jgi:hypothetical protein
LSTFFVETLWSLAKRNFRKLLLLPRNRDLDREQIKELILEAFQMISVQQVNGILNANRRSLRNYLKKAAVSEQQ